MNKVQLESQQEILSSLIFGTWKKINKNLLTMGGLNIQNQI
jgi:hypothetical protein